jgi:hypothetical protein
LKDDTFNACTVLPLQYSELCIVLKSSRSNQYISRDIEEPLAAEGPMPPKSLISAKALPMSFKRSESIVGLTHLTDFDHWLCRIPKKWKWSGELFVDVARNSAERLCYVTLTDSSDHLAEGLRFSVLFSSMDSLRLKKMHGLVDVEWLLQACSPIQQFAKMIPQDEKDTSSFTSLVKHMAKKQMVSNGTHVNDIQLTV